MTLTDYLDGSPFVPEKGHTNGFFKFRPSDSLLKDYAESRTKPEDEWITIVVGYIDWIDLNGNIHIYAKIEKQPDETLTLGTYILSRYITVEIDETMIKELVKIDSLEAAFPFN